MNQFLEKWDRRDLLEHLDEFYELYNQRPIKDNTGGMKSPHMFSAWYIIKKLSPKFLIESGVWKGLGTWFFRKAIPNTKIISIDPSPHFREYTDSSAIYMTQDFGLADWSRLPVADTFLFFDDHQNCMSRLKQAHSIGFRRFIFEDNYPFNQGDCYTPKKILSDRDYVIDKDGQRHFFTKNKEDLEFFKSNIKIYQEMPPIFKDKQTRWGDAWDEINYPTPLSLLPNDYRDKYKTFYNERFDYTWICYLEIG